MQVTVRDISVESEWGSGPFSPATRKVTISDYCQQPGCGTERGKPSGLNSSEDGVHWWVQTWNNPCGHVDSYTAVIAEAKALAAEKGEQLPSATYH